MKQEIADRWVRELRLPGRPQIQGNLSSLIGDCCLGVLCKIAVEDGVIETIYSNNENLIRYGVNDDFDVYNLPRAVIEWAGMHSVTGEFDGSLIDGFETRNDLALLNDRGRTFSEIADIIEAHVQEL